MMLFTAINQRRFAALKFLVTSRAIKVQWLELKMKPCTGIKRVLVAAKIGLVFQTAMRSQYILLMKALIFLKQYQMKLQLTFITNQDQHLFNERKRKNILAGDPKETGQDTGLCYSGKNH